LKKDAPGITAQIYWVYTQDLDSTADFYAQTLGLECSRGAGDARLFQTGDSAYIGLCRAFADRVIEPRGSLISIVTDDVDAWYQHLLDNGLVIDKPPEQIEQFGIYSFFIKDPNGYLLEFQQFITNSGSE